MINASDHHLQAREPVAVATVVSASVGRAKLAVVCQAIGVAPEVLTGRQRAAPQLTPVGTRDAAIASYWRRCRAAWLLRQQRVDGRLLSWPTVACILKLGHHTTAMRAAEAWHRTLVIAAADPELRRVLTNQGVLPRVPGEGGRS